MAGARHFDADSEVITVTETARLTDLFDGGGTLACWCFPTSVPSTQRMMAKLTTNQGWSFYFSNSSNSFTFFYYFSGDNYREDVDAALVTNQWQYFSLTYDADSSANRASMYIDCSLEASTTAIAPTGTRDSDSGLNFAIGNIPGATAALRGDICYCQAWDRVLSVNEMKESMYKPGSVRTNLIGFWPCLGDSPERDLSGFGQTGAVTGADTVNDGPFLSRFE